MKTKVSIVIAAVLLLAGCGLFQNEMDKYETELARLQAIWSDLELMFNELVEILGDQQITDGEFHRLGQMKGTVEAYKGEVETIARKIQDLATDDSARISALIDVILRLLGKLS